MLRPSLRLSSAEGAICYSFSAIEKLGTYVQVPFCQTKCTYCNFHTGVVAKERFRPYVVAVCAEIRRHREWLRAAGVEWGGSGRPLSNMCGEVVGINDALFLEGGESL